MLILICELLEGKNTNSIPIIRHLFEFFRFRAHDRGKAMDCTCAMTGQSFTVTDEELAFLRQVSPVIADKTFLIPPPQLCPDCRQQRRLTYRNERTFYRRTCSQCGRNILALYPADAPCPVFCDTCYWGDRWDPLQYGFPFDPSQPFFTQFAVLQRTVPHLFFSSTNSENSEYCNHVSFMKNCYLVHGSMHSQNCYYSTRAFRCSDCMDCLFINDCELCYECVNCDECYDVRHAYHCQGCHTSCWIQHCHASRDLLFCVNRRQAQYQILNQQKTRGEYERIKGEIDASPEAQKRFLADFQHLLLDSPIPSRIVDLAEACTGNYIRQCRSCHHVFDAQKCQNVRFGFDTEAMNDCQDIYSVYGPGELCYELYSANNAHSTLFSHDCWPAEDLLYCDHCFGCSKCFGCLGLHKKSYCILNRQYTKEEYEALTPRIIEHMQHGKEFGEFFPAKHSPFAYNETPAQEYFPMTRGAVEQRGWAFREQRDEMPNVSRVIRSTRLPVQIEDVPDDILNWAVECEVTKRPFKIIKQELDFYRKMHVPVPHVHPDERHRRRMNLRNPRKLWNRQCANCQKPIATSYSPDRPETVYCEECYLKEVY
ncbi:MAG: hypothetical protein V1926_00225 [Candidatus Peregrinibacteria bacterium]